MKGESLTDPLNELSFEGYLGNRDSFEPIISTEQSRDFHTHYTRTDCDQLILDLATKS